MRKVHKVHEKSMRGRLHRKLLFSATLHASTKYKRMATDAAHERYDVEPVLADVARICRRFAADSGEFVVETTSGAIEGRNLPLTHEKVEKFVACSA